MCQQFEYKCLPKHIIGKQKNKLTVDTDFPTFASVRVHIYRARGKNAF